MMNHNVLYIVNAQFNRLKNLQNNCTLIVYIYNKGRTELRYAKQPCFEVICAFCICKFNICPNSREFAKDSLNSSEHETLMQ